MLQDDKVNICAKKRRNQACIVVKLGTLLLPAVPDGTNVLFASRTECAKDFFAAKDGIESTETPLRTKGCFFCLTGENIPGGVELLRLWSPDRGGGCPRSGGTVIVSKGKERLGV